MSQRLFLALFAVLFLPLGATAGAGVPDPATLMPARTLAYLELSDPSRCAAELRALTRGSYLEDPLRMLVPLRQAGIHSEELLFCGLGVAPEILGELGDWQGAAVALTGFTSQQYPEIVGVIHTGRSRMLPLAMRTLLAATEVRVLRKVEGVEIYQVGDAEKGAARAVAVRRRRGPATVFLKAFVPEARRRARLDALLGLVAEDPLAAPPPPVPVVPPPAAPAPAAPADNGEAGTEEKPEFGFFCSLLPESFLFATTPDALAEALGRLKGKSRGPTLVQAPAFREAVAERRKPDLFLYVDAPALTRWVDDAIEKKLVERRAEVRQANKAQQDQEATPEARKAKAAELPKELEEAERQHREENAAWYALRMLANPAGMRFLSSSVTIHDSDLTWRLDARMREGQTSPLLELLADRPLTENLLRGLPRDSWFLMALPVGDGAGTWQKVVRLAGALHALAPGDDPSPEKLLRDFEKQRKLRLDRDVFGRLRGLAWGFRVGPYEREDRPEVSPGVLVIEAKDADDARALEDLLPRLLAREDKPAEPQAVRVLGQTVQSLVGEEEKTAETLPAFYGRRGRLLLLGWHRQDVAGGLRDAGEPVELRDHPRALTALRAAGPASAAALFSGRQALASIASQFSKKEKQTDKDLRNIQYLREVSTPMAAMPPTVFVLRRRPDGLRFEMTQPELRTAAVTLIDVAVAAILDETRKE